MKIDSNEELVAKIKKGENTKENLELLYYGNLPLIRNICKPYEKGGNMSDLLSCAFLGIVAAIPTYDPAKSSFFHYAPYFIKNEIRRYKMEVESTFSVSPGFYEKIGKYKKGVSEYEFRFGHTPTDQQISVFLDMPLKTIESIKTVLSPTIPFDALVGDDGNTTIREVVSDGSRFEDDVEMREDALSLWETIEKRVDDGRNLEILRLRFCEGWSIPRIADEYGISRQRVDQICKKSLEKVRRDDRISDYIVQEVDSMNDYSGSGFTAFNRRWASSVEWSVLNREKKKERLSGRIKSKKAAIDRKYSFLGVDSTEKGFDNSGE